MTYLKGLASAFGVEFLFEPFLVGLGGPGTHPLPAVKQTHCQND